MYSCALLNNFYQLHEENDMKFVAYFGPGRLPLYIQQKSVRGWVKTRWKDGQIIHEILVDKDDADFGFIGLKEATRLAVKHGATIIASGYDVLSRNGRLLSEVMEKVSIVTCEFPFSESRRGKRQWLQ
jgi:hypothetical protein